jgi:hypothetical protein
MRIGDDLGQIEGCPALPAQRQRQRNMPTAASQDGNASARHTGRAGCCISSHLEKSEAAPDDNYGCRSQYALA